MPSCRRDAELEPDVVGLRFDGRIAVGVRPGGDLRTVLRIELAQQIPHMNFHRCHADRHLASNGLIRAAVTQKPDYLLPTARQRGGVDFTLSGVDFTMVCGRSKRGAPSLRTRGALKRFHRLASPAAAPEPASQRRCP